MRISFFVPRCTPDNSHGRYVIELAKRFSRGHTVAVYAGAFWPPLQAVVRCSRLPVPNRPAVGRLAVLWGFSAIQARRRPADIVHIQGADAPVGNVVTAHCCNAAMHAAADGRGSFSRKLNYSIGKLVERHCFTKKSTRMVIAVSHQVKADIEKYYDVDPQRIVVVPHGVDGEAFHPRNRSTSRPRVRKQLGLSDTDFVALFVGGDYRLKGLLPLLQAARRVPRVRILAAGVHQSPAIEQAVHQNDLDGRVALLGSASDMPSLYATADCFVLPTRYDTFSLATLEAMASGLPVIVSRAAGVSELLTSGKDCLVLDDPDDVGVLTEQLEKLVADETLRASLGSSARVTAERYSWAETAAHTASVYRAALRT